MSAKYAVYYLSQLKLAAFKPGANVDHAAAIACPELNRPAQHDLSALDGFGQ